MKYKYFTKTLNKMILSYVLVLIVPITVGIYTFRNIDKFLISNIEKNNTSLMRQVMILIDNHISHITKVSNLISFDTDILQYLNATYTNEEYQTYKVSQRIKSLRNIDANANMISNFFIYSYESDTIISTDIKAPSEKYFHLSYTISDGNSKEMCNTFRENLLFPSKNVQYVSRHTVGSDKLNIFGINFVQKLPLNNMHKKGVLVVDANADYLNSLIGEMSNANNSSVFILDNTDNLVVCNTSDYKLLDYFKKEETAINSISLVTTDSGNYYLSMSESEQSEWKSYYCEGSKN